jgi:hypothetical protein
MPTTAPKLNIDAASARTVRRPAAFGITLATALYLRRLVTPAVITLQMLQCALPGPCGRVARRASAVATLRRAPTPIYAVNRAEHRP